jgi:hypothetical protein
MDPTDISIWDAAYDEEYDGLVYLTTWDVVSEEQFKQLNQGKRVLPAMAIATINYDENNKPKRAKSSSGARKLGLSHMVQRRYSSSRPFTIRA